MSTELLSKPIESHPEFAGILKDEIPFESPSQPYLPRLVNGAFDRLMLQSGLNTSPTTFLAVCAVTTVCFGGVAFLLTKAAFPLLAFGCIGMLTPLVIANHFREHRQSVLLSQLPDSIDRIARLSQTGRNLESALDIVASDSAAPLAAELVHVSEALKVGTTVSHATHGFAARTGLPAASMLGSVLSVHSESGGELSTPLFELADDVREQILQRNRERAIEAEAQWPATAVILLPMAVGLIYVFNEPAIAGAVLNSFVGRAILSVSVVLWALGSLIALRGIRQRVTP